ncbi:MAG TPA: hypothetical protein VMT53_13215 [Terriglobales bacterium]|nr:hypothetical protein [Terriglobales bacterium]
MRLLTALAVLVAVFSFAYYLQHNYILLYGDAVAHINIARRVFDSKTPGLLQLGTVWLPLPHLLMIPFLLSASAWQSGAGGSIPSLIAYVFAVVGIFRLTRNALSFPGEPDTESRISAWLAAVALGANPNLIYLQSTAMTEPLYLAFFIWVIVHFEELSERLAARSEEVSSARGSLWKCGLCAAAAEFTRYDGWLLGIVIALAAMALIFLKTAGLARREMRHALRNFLLVAAAAPVIWLAYNGIIYRNPLEFANGPYSAKAIEKKSATPGFPRHPGSHNVVAAGQYFLKAAEDNLAEGVLQRIWIAIAVLGSILALILDRRLGTLLLLWLPLLFYALSIAYGGVPVFVPNWWPFSYYNVRYGIELLPCIAVFFGGSVYFFLTLARPRVSKAAIAVIAVGFLIVSYISAWHAQPASFREAWVNSRSRIALERTLATNLRKLPPESTLLMYLGDHVGALQDAGIPLSHVIQEGNHRTWKQPSDPEGLWERALANPGAFADFAIGIDDDPVARSAHQHGLTSLLIVETPGQPRATIYATHGQNR